MLYSLATVINSPEHKIDYVHHYRIRLLNIVDFVAARYDGAVRLALAVPRNGKESDLIILRHIESIVSEAISLCGTVFPTQRLVFHAWRDRLAEA